MFLNNTPHTSNFEINKKIVPPKTCPINSIKFIPKPCTFISLPLSFCCLVSKACLTLYDPMDCSMQGFLSFSISQSFLKLICIESVMPYNHLMLCCPLLLLPSFFSNIRVFSSELAPSFSVSPSTEYSGLISFRIDWLDLLVVQGPLKSLLQRHNSKSSILWCSAFFMVQLSHLYMTTE